MTTPQSAIDNWGRIPVGACTCELVDASTYGEPYFVRGYHNGCVVHATEQERELWRQEQRRRADRQARIEAAMREARTR